MLKNKQPKFCEIISKSFDASDFSYLDGLVECLKMELTLLGKQFEGLSLIDDNI